MNNFLETYGKAIFTLVLVAILIAFASPLGMKIKNATTEKISTTEEIGSDEVYVATTGRPKPPKEVNDYVYAILYDDGELVISGTEITPDKNRAIFTCSQGSGNFGKVIIYKNNKFECPKWTNSACGHSEFSKHITSVNILNRIQPKSCAYWFSDCGNLTEIKNIENLYTDKCVSMLGMFSWCDSLTSIDLHYFNTSQVTEMQNMFWACQSLISLDLSNFDTSNVTNMHAMFCHCDSLKDLNINNFNINNGTDIGSIFNCPSLKAKSVKVSQTTYEKLKLQLSVDKFDIVK